MKSNTANSAVYLTNSICPVQEIIDDMRAGRMVILVDEEHRENEGDLVLAAEMATPDRINFMAKHGRGLICLTLTEEHCRRLDLPLMVRNNHAAHNTAFTVSIEAAEGVTTGISTHDRARTILAAVDKNASPKDIVQPGHVFPLMAQQGGVLVRAGHTEAGCDLAALAGLVPSAVICEIMNDDGSMARLSELQLFARQHNLKIGTISDLIQYRAENESLVECVADKEIVCSHGGFRLRAFRDKSNNEVHLALTMGSISPEQETLVRVHEAISVLDFLDCESRRHSYDVESAMQTISHHGKGALVLLHRHESGDDLIAMLNDEDVPLAAKWDPRTYGIGAQILRELGIGKMRLLSSPRKMPSMAGFGLEVCGYLTS